MKRQRRQGTRSGVWWFGMGTRSEAAREAGKGIKIILSQPIEMGLQHQPDVTHLRAVLLCGNFEEILKQSQSAEIHKPFF